MRALSDDGVLEGGRELLGGGVTLGRLVRAQLSEDGNVQVAHVGGDADGHLQHDVLHVDVDEPLLRMGGGGWSGGDDGDEGEAGGSADGAQAHGSSSSVECGRM